MIWLLQKISEWLNRPYDFGPELDALRKRQAERDNERG